MIHADPHPLAGKTVKLKQTAVHPLFNLAGQDYRIEDWHDRVAGGSWWDCDVNNSPASLIYSIRVWQLKMLPEDNAVLYGKTFGFGHLIHISEIENYDELMAEYFHEIPINFSAKPEAAEPEIRISYTPLLPGKGY